MAEKLLQGRRIVLTRASGQSDEMASLLEGLGAEVISFSTIEFAPPDDWGPLDRALDRIGDYDWIVFTSANGVRFFLERLAERLAAGLETLARLTCCAIGPATAAALRKAAVRVDVIATDSKAEGTFSAIVERLGGKDKLAGVRFLIPRAAVGRDLLLDELKKWGANAEAVSVYRTLKPEGDAGWLADMLDTGSVDAITFTSSSTVSNFAALIGRANLADLLRNVVVGCIGPITAATAAEYGIEDIVQPEVYTSDALASAIAETLRKSKKKVRS